MPKTKVNVRQIVSALIETKNIKVKAAVLLGINDKTLQSRFKTLQMKIVTKEEVARMADDELFLTRK